MINITKRCLALLLCIGFGLGGTASVPISDRATLQKGASEVCSTEAQDQHSECQFSKQKSGASVKRKASDITSQIYVSEGNINYIYSKCIDSTLSEYRDIQICYDSLNEYKNCKADVQTISEISDNKILTEYSDISAISDNSILAENGDMTAIGDNTKIPSCESAAVLSDTMVYPETEYIDVLSENVKVGSRFLELFFGEKKETRKLIACGGAFGVRIKQKHPTVVEASGVPALKCGDLIISINNQNVNSAEDVKNLINSSGGGSVTVEARRGDDTVRIEVVPKQEGDEYRLGITLKDVTSGIGTITFIDPETGEFGGLGHGICDSENGNIIEMQSGEAVSVVLGGIHKGECGNPGELSGIMTDKVIGRLDKNCDVGVFGRLASDDISSLGDIYEVGTREDVTAGEATIISTLRNGKKSEYKIEIYDIDESSDGSKSFKIKVNDPALVAISGGIVRGMSGSPIIQNGKLIGAVTHVLVNDPTSGYGIFIENMLDVAD